MQLSELNLLPDDKAQEEFLRCCHSRRWAGAMVSQRPYASFEQLLKCAEDSWWCLDRDAWLEAFSAHPKIGDMNSLRQKYANTKDWSALEQSGVNDAQERVLVDLAAGNKKYEEKFGYIFIVCATGKSANEMLAILESRLSNAAEQEIKIAAGEQSKITRIRLEKLCQEVPSQPTC